MAYTKIQPLNSTATRIEYCEGRDPDKFHKSGIGTNILHPEDDFAEIRAMYRADDPTDPRKGYDLIQSLDPVQSQKISIEEYNKIGRELVRQLCPGYQAAIYTHADSDGGNLHNHIILNSINMYTGRRLHSDQKFLHEMRRLSDEICLAHGLDLSYTPLREKMTQAEIAIIKKNNYHRNKAAQLTAEGDEKAASDELKKIKRLWKAELKMALVRAASTAKNGHEFAASLAQDGFLYDMQRGKDGKYHAMYFDTISHRSISESTLNKQYRESDGTPTFSTSRINSLIARNRPEVIAEISNQKEFENLPPVTQKNLAEQLRRKFEKTVRQKLLEQGDECGLLNISDEKILKETFRAGLKVSLMSVKSAGKITGYAIKTARAIAKPLQAIPVIGNFFKAADSVAAGAEKGIEAGARSIKEPANKGGSKNDKKSQSAKNQQKLDQSSPNLVHSQHLDSGVGGDTTPQQINWADIPPALREQIKNEEEQKAEKIRQREQDEAAWNQMCAAMAQVINEQERQRAARETARKQMARQREEQDTEPVRGKSPAPAVKSRERVRSRGNDDSEEAR